MSTYFIKVQSTSSGNKYFISTDGGNNYTQAPSLQLDSTQTITFEIADGSMSNHPLFISTSNDTGANQISNDTNASISGQGISSQGQKLILTIPSGSIYIGTTLHYVCGNHPGMGNTLSVTQICFPENMKVATANGAVNIQDLKRGDFILTKNGVSKLARLVITKKYGDVEFVQFKKNSIDIYKPFEDLLVTPTHPIFHNGRFMESKDLINNKDITLIKKKMEKIYNIQFETEESIYVNNLEFVSHHPDHFIEHLEEDLFFNKNLFKKDKSGQYNKPF
jgi:hypothetical protein